MPEIHNYIKNVIALKQLKGIGTMAVLNMPKEELKAIESIKELMNFLKKHGKANITEEEITKAYNYAEKLIKENESKDIKIICDIDLETYPKYLLKIKDHPPIIFAKGNIKLLTEDNLIAIVGSRSSLIESLNFTKEITKKFVSQDFVIVSGLAEGIDTQAHKTAVENKGKTIAVLPSDLLNIYPTKNKQLAQEILDNEGLLISEYPINSNIGKHNFIERDRIESGLSLAVFVIESKEDGGTMQTASFCQKQERLLIVLNQDKNISNFSGNQELIIKMKENKNIIEYKKDLQIPDYVTADKLRESAIQYNVEDRQIQDILIKIKNTKDRLQNKIFQIQKEKGADQATLF